jgi:hypothetical protein
MLSLNSFKQIKLLQIHYHKHNVLKALQCLNFMRALKNQRLRKKAIVRVNNWAQSHSHMLLSILSENSYKESFFAPESFSEISLDINKDRWSHFIIK